MKSSKKRRKPIGLMVTAAVLLVLVIMLLLGLPRNEGIYRTLCDDGYTGTQEQLIASLVGEEAAPQGETAYDLAVKNGYRKSQSHWMTTLTGADSSKTPYQAACENGYQGTLIQWLNQIVEQPEALGKSTEYERACAYGYTGTYIEWLVWLTSDHR